MKGPDGPPVSNPNEQGQGQSNDSTGRGELSGP